MNIIGLIPARSGSKRVPGKNIKMCAGKPLILWTIEAALSSNLDDVYVSSDSQEILSLCRDINGLKILTRPNKLADDEVPMLPVISHFLENIEKTGVVVDAVMLLQPTSPLRNGSHINAAIEQFTSSNYDSLVSVVKAPHAFHPDKILTIQKNNLQPYYGAMNDAESKIAVGRNGPAILLSKTDVFRQEKLYGENVSPFIMDKSVSIDIDEPFDFNLAEWLLK